MRPSLKIDDTNNAAEPRVEVRLVDTSVWIRADRKSQKQVRDRLKGFVVAGSAYICWPIRTELLTGAKNEERFQSLDDQLAALPHLPFTDDTWREAARVGRKLARKGQTVPLIDLLISCVAIASGMILWTVDSDFKRVAANTELRVDWFGVK